MIDKNTIYSYFQTDDFPTEEQFRATWDSFWHKSEFIPISRILGLNELFQQTVTITYLNSYIKKDLSSTELAIGKLNATQMTTATEKSIGGSQPHNNVQPSIVANYIEWVGLD